MIRIIPNIPKIKAKWDRRSSELPWLDVPMSDGTTVRYYADVPQPSFVRTLEIIRNMKDVRVGYEKK